MAKFTDCNTPKPNEVGIRQGIDKKLYFFVGLYALDKSISKKQAVVELIQKGWETYKKEEDLKNETTAGHNRKKRN